MAIGDQAAAAGLSVVPSTQDARLGYQAINQRGDELGNHLVNGGHDAARISGTLPLANGGTGATSAAGALTTLGAAPAAHTHDDRYYTETEMVALLSDRVLAYGGDGNIAAQANGPSSAAYGRNAGSNRYAVWMDDTLSFGRSVSARKYKDGIEAAPLDPADVLALQPVTYHLKTDPEGVREFGLIADDVAQTLPQIVTHYDGEIDGIRYDLLAVALLAVVQSQQSQINALADRLATLEVE